MGITGGVFLPNHKIITMDAAAKKNWCFILKGETRVLEQKEAPEEPLEHRVCVGRPETTPGRQDAMPSLTSTSVE